MGRRSSKTVVLGAAVFVLGAGLVFIGLRSSSDSATPPPTVVVTTSPDPGAGVVAQAGGTEPITSVRVPRGHEAVAVQLQHVPGLAGYAQPGNHINVYATVKGGASGSRLAPPYAKLILTNVEVLDVGVGSDGGDPTFLLALTARDAESLIFYAKFESLWASLVPDGAAPASTGGFDHSDALRRGP